MMKKKILKIRVCSWIIITIKSYNNYKTAPHKVDKVNKRTTRVHLICLRHNHRKAKKEIIQEILMKNHKNKRVEGDRNLWGKR